jgi:hypothetical protein
LIVPSVVIAPPIGGEMVTGNQTIEATVTQLDLATVNRVPGPS